ncbi:UNKNOWN [Stylonychia lemnae]|uniref:Uncharacterized protein n=1 Tax=Stylonychia lemnae TaxID=5949 RepID=A0A078ACU9_STYLE|nr:UNKNOWN [Stylonychia lemnae]|eukprot:CDW79691.1 UNKNOWN [Stylonychia lemnae]
MAKRCNIILRSNKAKILSKDKMQEFHYPQAILRAYLFMFYYKTPLHYFGQLSESQIAKYEIFLQRKLMRQPMDVKFIAIQICDTTRNQSLRRELLTAYLLFLRGGPLLTLVQKCCHMNKILVD